MVGYDITLQIMKFKHLVLQSISCPYLSRLDKYFLGLDKFG